MTEVLRRARRLLGLTPARTYTPRHAKADAATHDPAKPLERAS